MIAVILVSYGRLAQEFVNSASYILGPQACLDAVCLFNREADQKTYQQLCDIIAAQEQALAERYRGTLILTDVFGGAASHMALSMLHEPRIEVVAGMNLPMLVRVLMMRHKDSLQTLTAKAEETGREHMKSARKFLEPVKRSAA